MLTYNDLKTGTIFTLDGEPYEVLEFEFLRMQQRKPVAKTKIKNLINGKILERNFHQNETFEEAEIEKEAVKYLYNHREQYWFSRPVKTGRGSPQNGAAARFFLTEELVGPAGKFFKPNTEVTVLKFNEKIIQVSGPIKADLKVKEAPPGIKGDTAQGGTKTVTLETGAKIAAPLFINAGDVVRVNTETGQYVERIEKSKE